MNKIAVGMICDSYEHRSSILKKIKSINQLYFDLVQYYYNCIGFRAVDLDTLEIEDYSIKEAIGLAGGIKGINPFDERDLVDGKLTLCQFGYTERFMVENFIDSNGQFSTPSLMCELPVIPSKRASFSLVSRYKKNKEINKQIVVIGDNINVCLVYVDIIRKGITVELHRNPVYSCGRLEMLSEYSSGFNYSSILVEDKELFGLYDKFGCDAVVAFGDTLVVNLTRKSLCSDIMIPNTFKKVVLDGSDLSEYSNNSGKSYNIVIPPSVDDITAKTKYFSSNTESRLKHIKLTLHISEKRKDLVYKIYSELSDNNFVALPRAIRSMLTKDGYKDIINYIADECKVGIELY